MTQAFRTGQRWISVSEPELGLGEVRAVGPRSVTMWFAAADETRQYVASDDAPLRRAAFRVGDTVSLSRGGSFTIEAVVEHEGLLRYQGSAGEITERELSAQLTFNSPVERLFAGQFDSPSLFQLRQAALCHQHRRRQSPVRGFIGARINLLPHQMGIAAEVTSRLLPRVLLADEVGLGKTIEACLIVHRLLTTGRARRVLVIVPETLTHQWFLELLRRFNLWFHIFTEARCIGIEENGADVNPFLDDQLVLCELPLFINNPTRLEQAVAAGWDLVVVDEAHHLQWSPAEPSVEYEAIERLARVAPGLLLLTATPEQLGRPGHFARLRLLDPSRFHDLEQFNRESERYRHVARLATALHDGGSLKPDERDELARLLNEPPETFETPLSAFDAPARGRWLDLLTDEHGTGRVMFRNTRASVGGFPARVAHLDVLDAAPAGVRGLGHEWREDAEGVTSPARASLSEDPRVEWLLRILKTWERDKLLVICRTPRRALALEAVLALHTTSPLAAFHEEMTLLQRDRSAAWFADPDGARLLICSEIGSEGRNFQFAHHLVLFDIPLDPGVLEQRIGRLDRIGQRSTIHLHVPVVPGTHLEVLARWYHEGLHAFERHVPGARELLDRFDSRLRTLAAPTGRGRSTGESLDAFVEEVQTARQEVVARLEAGRDRLLEWNSLRREQAADVISEISRLDTDLALDSFMLLVFDTFFIEVEELSPRTYRLGSAGVLLDSFPGLGSDAVTVTCSRERALDREDVQFLTWDHPLAAGALDLVLTSEKGNCAFARWIDDGKPVLYLEALFVLESIAPASLHVDRFLPPTPVRVAVDHAGRDATAIVPDRLERTQASSSGRALLARPDVKDRLVPRMLERARATAEASVPTLVESACQRMRTTLDGEIARLTHLQRRNPVVRSEEIAAIREHRDALDAHLRRSRLRLDAVQLIYRGPERDTSNGHHAGSDASRPAPLGRTTP